MHQKRQKTRYFAAAKDERTGDQPTITLEHPQQGQRAAFRCLFGKPTASTLTKGGRFHDLPAGRLQVPSFSFDTKTCFKAYFSFIRSKCLPLPLPTPCSGVLLPGFQQTDDDARTLMSLLYNKICVERRHSDHDLFLQCDEDVSGRLGSEARPLQLGDPCCGACIATW